MTSSVVFSGDLEYLNLGELIQLIGSNGSTGTLRIISKYVEKPGLVYFKEGNPIEAKAGSKAGLEGLYALFGWTEGEFEFVNNKVTVKHVIKSSRMEIILEGLRLFDDGNIEVKGAVSIDASGKDGEKDALPLIRGPMIDYMDIVAEEEYQDGQPIVNEGKHGSWMWVILEGKIDICRKTDNGLSALLRLGVGSFIGNLTSFSVEGYVRSATAVASDRVILGVLDRQRLSHEFSLLSPGFKNILASLDNRLRQVTDLAASTKEQMLAVKPVAKGQKPVIKEGSEKKKLFTIRQGSAKIVKQLPKVNLLLGELGEKDVVGQIPFLNIGHEPTSASIFGSEDLEMDALNTDSLMEEYQRLSGTMGNMIENSANFIAATTGVALNIIKKEKK